MEVARRLSSEHRSPAHGPDELRFPPFQALNIGSSRTSELLGPGAGAFHARSAWSVVIVNTVAISGWVVTHLSSISWRWSQDQRGATVLGNPTRHRCLGNRITAQKGRLITSC